MVDQKPPKFKIEVFLIYHTTKQLSFFHTFVNNLVLQMLKRTPSIT